MKISKHLLLTTTGFAAASILVFSGFGIAALTGNLNLLAAAPPAKAAASSPAGTDRTRPPVVSNPASCPNCGVVQSIERASSEEMSGPTGGSPTPRAAGTGGNGATIFVVRLRMDDGSQRVIQELFAPAFSVGQRIRVVNGLLLASS